MSKPVFKNGKLFITRKEYKKTHSDYKGIIEGKPYIMHLDEKQGTIYCPVEFIERGEQ